MRRAKLVTDEMLQSLIFDRFAIQIDRLISRGSLPSAKGRITTLMKKLLSAPSQKTIEFFIEMHRRWGGIADVFKFLEANWDIWATWEDRMEILWHKFGARQANADFIQAAYSAMEMIDPANCTLRGKEQLQALIGIIVDFESHVGVRCELLKVIELRYGHVMNVRRYLRNLFDRRVPLTGERLSFVQEQIRELFRRTVA